MNLCVSLRDVVANVQYRKKRVRTPATLLRSILN